jgi:hypothetical protein
VRYYRQLSAVFHYPLKSARLDWSVHIIANNIVLVLTEELENKEAYYETVTFFFFCLFEWDELNLYENVRMSAVN